MIFQYTYKKVLDKNKFETRRRIKPGERLLLADDYKAMVTVSGRRQYRTGHTYSVQPGRGKKQVARIRITDIRRGDVREISDADVTAEGFTTRREFLLTWVTMHDPKVVDSLEHPLGGVVASTETIEKHLASRPLRYYEAWVFEFELVEVKNG